MGLCGFNLHRDQRRRALRKSNAAVAKRDLSVKAQQKVDSKEELPIKTVGLSVSKKKVLRKRKVKKKE